VGRSVSSWAPHWATGWAQHWEKHEQYWAQCWGRHWGGALGRGLGPELGEPLGSVLGDSWRRAGFNTGTARALGGTCSGQLGRSWSSTGHRLGPVLGGTLGPALERNWGGAQAALEHWEKRLGTSLGDTHWDITGRVTRSFTGRHWVHHWEMHSGHHWDWHWVSAGWLTLGPLGDELGTPVGMSSGCCWEALGMTQVHLRTRTRLHWD
jgi:hypothetical protein